VFPNTASETSIIMDYTNEGFQPEGSDSRPVSSAPLRDVSQPPPNRFFNDLSALARFQDEIAARWAFIRSFLLLFLYTVFVVALSIFCMGIILQYVYNIKIDNFNDIINQPDISYFGNTMTLSDNQLALSPDSEIVFRNDNGASLGSLSVSEGGGITLARLVLYVVQTMNRVRVRVRVRVIML
jgi:hypothetical protein